MFNWTYTGRVSKENIKIQNENIQATTKSYIVCQNAMDFVSRIQCNMQNWGIFIYFKMNVGSLNSTKFFFGLIDRT